jgi:hypothetical protein
MLSQNIYTWEPGQKDALIKRRIEWFDAGRSRGFILLETDDPKSAIISTMLWNDLKEIIPLVETSAKFPDEKG